MENCKFWTKGKHKADVKAKQPQSSICPKMKQSCCAFKKGRKADVKAKQPHKHGNSDFGLVAFEF